jgi:hypothetical protein
VSWEPLEGLLQESSLQTVERFLKVWLFDDWWMREMVTA